MISVSKRFLEVFWFLCSSSVPMVADSKKNGHQIFTREALLQYTNMAKLHLSSGLQLRLLL
ncbi:hypothetical protein HanRHA438_Chr10g0447121 [Helianthus annuus]|nr:hypothetical protein HanRHA438_Chr10g0447121 [Helianthus annuus]